MLYIAILTFEFVKETPKIVYHNLKLFGFSILCKIMFGSFLLVNFDVDHY